MNFKPSKDQQNIFKFIKNDNKNAIISAVAGSGKTILSVAAGLVQTIDSGSNNYERLIFRKLKRIWRTTSIFKRRK
jgi:predicted ribonuclease YlaK